jgi:hypothetical protein
MSKSESKLEICKAGIERFLRHDSEEFVWADLAVLIQVCKISCDNEQWIIPSFARGFEIK